MRRLIFSLSLLLLSALPLSANTSATTIEQDLAQAKQHLEAKAYPKALEAYSKVISQQAFSLPALLGRARVYYAQSETDDFIYARFDLLEKALDDLQVALKYHKDQPDALIFRANVYREIAAFQAEMGSGAINYWEYYSAEVEPYYTKAAQDYEKLLKLGKFEAQSKYYLVVLDESGLMDSAQQQAYLKRSCELKFELACKLLSPQG